MLSNNLWQIAATQFKYKARKATTTAAVSACHGGLVKGFFCTSLCITLIRFLKADNVLNMQNGFNYIKHVYKECLLLPISAESAVFLERTSREDL